MNGSAVRPPSGPTGRPEARRLLLVGAVAVVGVIAAGLVWISVRPSPDRPPGVTGKLVYHGSATVHDGAVITVILGERSFNPTVLKGPAGARFVVHLVAEGFHAHTFTVPPLGIDVTVPPGGSTDVPVTMPATPSTVFYCRFHQAQGMQGALLTQQ